MTDKILAILNREPWGMHPHKAIDIVQVLYKQLSRKQILDLLAGAEDVEISKLWQNYHRLCVGEMVDMKESAKSYDDINKWQPALLKPSDLWAGEKPPRYDDWERGKPIVCADGKKEYWEGLYQAYHDRKKQVLFEEWDTSKSVPHSFMATWKDFMVEVLGGGLYVNRFDNEWSVAVENPTRDEFARTTGAKFTENAVKMIIG